MVLYPHFAIWQPFAFDPHGDAFTALDVRAAIDAGGPCNEECAIEEGNI